jgi:hypothetical protein
MPGLSLVYQTVHFYLFISYPSLVRSRVIPLQICYESSGSHLQPQSYPYAEVAHTIRDLVLWQSTRCLTPTRLRMQGVHACTR